MSCRRPRFPVAELREGVAYAVIMELRDILSGVGLSLAALVRNTDGVPSLGYDSRSRV